MTTKRFFCLLLASTAIGGTIALPAVAQAPATPTAPDATGNTSPPPPAAQWPGTTTTPVTTPGQPVPTQLDAVPTAATRTPPVGSSSARLGFRRGMRRKPP